MCPCERPGQIFLHWCGWTMWPTMFMYVSAQISVTFYFSFPLLRCGPLSNSSNLFFLYTLCKGVLWLLFSWKTLKKKGNLSIYTFFHFNNRNVSKSIIQRVKKYSASLGEKFYYTGECRNENTRFFISNAFFQISLSLTFSWIQLQILLRCCLCT